MFGWREGPSSGGGRGGRMCGGARQVLAGGGVGGWLESLGGLLFYCRQVKCPTSCHAVWLIHCPGVYGMGVHLEGRCYVG